MDYTPDRLRNLMLAGHSGSGKTSLAEAFLNITKSSDRFGNIADGTTVCDFDPEEIRRKASISTAIAPFDYDGCRINLVDVPGLFDFELGMYEGVMAVETVMTVVSARSGVAVGTHKANKIAAKNGRARMFFVSQMAVENADYGKTLAALQKDFGTSVCPVMVPVVADGKATVYVDLLENKAYTYEGGKATAVAVPEGVVDEYLPVISESVAETDEELLEKFMMDEPFTHEELVRGLSAGICSGGIAPVLCGDALTLEGLDLALRMIKHLAPAPVDMAAAKAIDKESKEIDIRCDAGDPLCCYIFKTVADPFVGKLSYVKVISGVLTGDAAIVNATTGNSERPGKLLSVKGKKQTDVKEIRAGDIGAITKLAETRTGDTLCGPSRVVTLKAIQFPVPSFSMAIFAKNKGDEGKIAASIQKILDEDKTVLYKVNGETGQQVISGLGEQHLDAVVSKLKSKFGIDIGLEVPRIAYRETIRAKAEAEGKHKKQSGGAGQFGVVQMRFEPLNDGGDFEFVNAVVGGTVPKEFIPAVEKGIREALVHGVLAGYPMVGLRATLYDGKYHPVDSKEVAFKSAARLAYKAACANAKPTLLEPIDNVKIYVPDSNTGDVMGEVTKRRGRVMGMSPAEDGLQLVEAEIPEAEMQDFTTFIRSSTQGRGFFTTKYERYDPLPGNLEQKVIDEAKELREKEEE